MVPVPSGVHGGPKKDPGTTGSRAPSGVHGGSWKGSGTTGSRAPAGVHGGLRKVQELEGLGPFMDLSGSVRGRGFPCRQIANLSDNFYLKQANWENATKKLSVVFLK